MAESRFAMPNGEDLATLIPYAVLAPSSHNTQPWRFRVDRQRIRIDADRSRSLPINDPDDRELFISCGCALMNLRVAAARAGLSCELHAFPDSADSDCVAELRFANDDLANDLAVLFDAIGERRTYRKPFGGGSVSEQTAEQLSQAAVSEHAWLKHLRVPDQRQKVADLVHDGDRMQWANRHWRRELATWMRAPGKGDGLAVPALMAPMTRMVVRGFNMGAGIGASDRQLALDAPLFSVLGSGNDSKQDWLQCGQALQRVLLLATHHGLQASFLNQPIQVGPLRSRLQQVLGIFDYPQIILRFGTPSHALPPAPRRPIDSVLLSD